MMFSIVAHFSILFNVFSVDANQYAYWALWFILVLLSLASRTFPLRFILEVFLPFRRIQCAANEKTSCKRTKHMIQAKRMRMAQHHSTYSKHMRNQPVWDAVRTERNKQIKLCYSNDKTQMEMAYKISSETNIGQDDNELHREIVKWKSTQTG